MSATDYYPFGAPMPGRTFNGSDYRHGFNGMEKDDEIKGSGNSYDFGARIYDPRIGRWMSVDPLQKHYAPISSYAFTLDNPIIFTDEDGRAVIGADGKPVTYSLNNGVVTWSANVTADIKALCEPLLKTSSGTKIVDDMIKSKKNIHVHIDYNPEGTVNTYLKSGNAAGMIVSKSMYAAINKGETPSESDFENAYTFDENTGLYNKTSDWDETHILLNGNTLDYNAFILATTTFNGDIEKGKDYAMIVNGGEEAAHTLQYTVEFTQRQLDPNTNKYIENTNPVEYENRQHEKWAKARAQKAADEYEENNK